MKRYELERCGDVLHPMYFIYVYSGKKRLRFLLDSGCADVFICESALEGCDMYKTEYTVNSSFANSTTAETSIIILNIRMTEDPNDRMFELTCSVAPNRFSAQYKELKYDGLLGAQFLQFCRVDFRNSRIEVGDRLGAIPNILHCAAEEYKAPKPSEKSLWHIIRKKFCK